MTTRHWTRSRVLGVLTALAALAATGALAAGPPLGKGPKKEWAAPACATVEGLATTSFTADEGLSWTMNLGSLSLGQLTTGIVALEAPYMMLAELGGTIFRSRDAGCSWKAYGSTPVSILQIVPGSGTEAYAFGFISGPEVFYLNAKAGPRSRAQQRFGLPTDVVQIVVDPADGDHLRALGRNGQIYESFDGAVTKWGAIGRAAPVGFLTYFAAFDRSNLDHVVVGTVNDGIFTTFDGGVSWQKADGLSYCAEPDCTPRVNAFNGVISPADGSVVYVMALDVNESDSGAPNRGRHIFRSDDGGLTFRTVADDGNGVVLPNGPALAAHPTDADLVYFSFGSRAQYPFGVNLYRYDDVSGQTTWNQSPDYFSIRAFAFNPADPSVIYAGFEGR